MECLDAVAGSAVAGHWRFRFEFAHDIIGSGDSVVLVIEPDRGSSWEVSLRVERGRVADLAVWDSVDVLRVGLPFGAVALDRASVTCEVPQGLVTPQRATARVLLNGAVAGAAPVRWDLDPGCDSPRPREFASA